jgi:WhiB family transcriptional regulator, redox-sensing transcriptional regulator
MGRQSSYRTSFARTHCLRLPPPVEDAWNWQLQGSCLGYPLDVSYLRTPSGPTFAVTRRPPNRSAGAAPFSTSVASTH